MARGAPLYAEVLGYGLTCDAYHSVAPHQEGIARSMRLAHRDAGVTPDEVDFISAHGTGTRANDVTEAAAIGTIFALGFAFMPEVARLSRSSVLVEKQKEYVEASRAVGESSLAIALRQILPNIVSPLIVNATVRLGYVILIVAALLGMKLIPPYMEFATARNAIQAIAQDRIDDPPCGLDAVLAREQHCVAVHGVAEQPVVRLHVVAGLAVAFRPKFGGYLVAAWLAGLIVNLLLQADHYDIALRDFGLLPRALALARLATSFGPQPAGA